MTGCMSNELSQRPIQRKSSGKVREYNYITTCCCKAYRKVKYNYETQNLKNLEQLNTLNRGINIKVKVGCSTIIAYSALNAHFPVLLMQTKRSLTSRTCASCNFKRARTNSYKCSLYIYTASQYLIIETFTIRCIFSLRTDM